MSSTIVSLSEGLYQRLHRLSAQAGQSPEAVLDQALAEYERKLLAGGQSAASPRSSSEAELLDDPGRIRMPPRGLRAVNVQVLAAGRQPPRLPVEED